ncbi:MAG: hypothetical protein A07HR60_02410 [uncultured archaeon A07HR60]|nr:MAG: hypothetical protein A07HR60_02410 [uncultured archaeon A07HR60]
MTNSAYEVALDRTMGLERGLALIQFLIYFIENFFHPIVHLFNSIWRWQIPSRIKFVSQLLNLR